MMNLDFTSHLTTFSPGATPGFCHSPELIHSHSNIVFHNCSNCRMGYKRHQGYLAKNSLFLNLYLSFSPSVNVHIVGGVRKAQFIHHNVMLAARTEKMVPVTCRELVHH